MVLLIESCPGTGRPVIETGSLAFETEGEEIAVLAEVVEKTRQPGLVSNAETGGESSGPIRDVPEVLPKGLPILPGWSGMGVVHLERLSGVALRKFPPFGEGGRDVPRS